ncbi:tyrosine-type recombinase/integrase [Streptomyces microflavus]|uniref:tyrosine-type recombinase/integrase n=1 Tax=Streptomyces microflavus TaxID=1919 RepID=UPI0036798CDF
MSGLSLDEAIATFLSELERAGVPHNTFLQYRGVLRRLQGDLAGRKFAGLKSSDLAAFLYGPGGITVGRASNTSSSYRSTLNSFLAHGHLMGWSKHPIVAPRPVIRMRATPGAANTPKTVAPTRLPESSLVLLLTRAEHPIMRGMLAVSIGTALRVGDIAKIRLGDVDFHTGEIGVVVSKTGLNDAWPITLDLEDELRRYLHWYTAATGRTAKDDGYLFPGWSPQEGVRTFPVTWVPDPDRKCSYGWARDRLKPLFEACGLEVEPGEAWHLIRRSVARIYFDRMRQDISYDHALRQTAALLGHKSTLTTEGYLGLQVDRLHRDESLKGKRFIGVAAPDNVTDLRRLREPS